MKTLRLLERTFGGKILQKIFELSKDKTQNNFEILILVKGLTGATWLGMTNMSQISISKEVDAYRLDYPAYPFNDISFLKSIEGYSDEDKGKAMKLLAQEIEHFSCLTNGSRLVLFSSGKEIANIDLIDICSDIL